MEDVVEDTEEDDAEEDAEEDDAQVGEDEKDNRAMKAHGEWCIGRRFDDSNRSGRRR